MAGTHPGKTWIAAHRSAVIAARSLHTCTTLGPYAGTVYPGYDSEEGQTVRAEVNTWLLGDSHPFDAVADSAAAVAVADPDHPTRIRDADNSGDGLHLDDAGAKTAADAVDLSLLDL